jgi:nucleoside-diphosphate-sugar epimerase
VDAIVDLATGASVELTWKNVEEDIRGRVNLLEEARVQGVRRYVFASSNHTTGMYEFDEPYASVLAGAHDGLDPASIPLIGSDWPTRPDSPYGVGKVASEGVARYFAEQHSLSCICLRIGTVRSDDRPKTSRHYATLLTHADLARLVGCALRAPLELRYGVYYGVSANTWRVWNIADAAADLGFAPHDDAERFRPQVNG